MEWLILFILLCICGFILFAKVRLNGYGEPLDKSNKVSIIIPARNEERNLPFILDSLKVQTYKPYEVIVVNDFSSDDTSKVASRYDVKLIENPELPDNWTGKTWALWNGFLQSTGDILVFLDADVRLAPCALESLLRTRERTGGAISVVPYNHTERFYERLSLVPYLLGVFAFTSPCESKNTQKGLYGSCIVTTRGDYEAINGHSSIRSELLDDLNLGRRFTEAGIRVNNFIGCDLVSFRMYPNGLKSEIQGFSKGAVLSTAVLAPATIMLIACWILGLFLADFMTPFLLVFRHSWSLPFLAGYVMYTLQIIYFLKYTGQYGRLFPVLHFLSTLFFILIMLYSIYQVTFLGCVSWKGRQIKVGGRKG